MSNNLALILVAMLVLGSFMCQISASSPSGKVFYSDESDDDSSSEESIFARGIDKRPSWKVQTGRDLSKRIIEFKRDLDDKLTIIKLLQKSSAGKGRKY